MDNIVYVEKKQINDEIGGETRTFHLWMYLRLRLEQGTNEGSVWNETKSLSKRGTLLWERQMKKC